MSRTPSSGAPRRGSATPERGRRVLVTGASSGIGEATALRFAQRGDDVALVARDGRALERLAERIRAEHGVRAEVVVADVGVRTQVEAAVEQAAAGLGGLDVIVCGAGAAAYGRFSEADPADVERTLQVDVFGVVDLVRAALPHLERSPAGRVVAVVSVLGLVPMPTLAAYVASKHGVRGFLGSLRVELRSQRSQVRVSMVHPGPVRTRFWRGMSAPGGRLPAVPPLAVQPDRIARAIVRVADRPRREVAVGPLMRPLLVFSALAPSLAERIVARLVPVAVAAGVPAPPRGRSALEVPVREAEVCAGTEPGR